MTVTLYSSLLSHWKQAVPRVAWPWARRLFATEADPAGADSWKRHVGWGHIYSCLAHRNSFKPKEKILLQYCYISCSALLNVRTERFIETFWSNHSPLPHILVMPEIAPLKHCTDIRWHDAFLYPTFPTQLPPFLLTSKEHKWLYHFTGIFSHLDWHKKGQKLEGKRREGRLKLGGKDSLGL